MVLAPKEVVAFPNIVMMSPTLLQPIRSKPKSTTTNTNSNLSETQIARPLFSSPPRSTSTSSAVPEKENETSTTVNQSSHDDTAGGLDDYEDYSQDTAAYPQETRQQKASRMSSNSILSNATSTRSTYMTIEDMRDALLEHLLNKINQGSFEEVSWCDCVVVCYSVCCMLLCTANIRMMQCI